MSICADAVGRSLRTDSYRPVLRAERPAARLAALFAPEIGTRNLTRGEEGASPTAEASRLKRDSTPKPDPDGPYSRIRTAIDQRGAFYMRPLVDQHEAGCQRKGESRIL